MQCKHNILLARTGKYCQKNRKYSKGDVKNLLINAGFLSNVSIKSKKIGSSTLHCVVGIK